jgi:hypothetical protein
MKAVLRILAILCVASIIAGVFSLVVDHTSLVAATGGAGGPPLALAGANGLTAGQPAGQPSARPDGGADHGGASLVQGLSGVLVSLSKLTGITAVILLAQSVFKMVTGRRLKIPA